jgi:hypothetical protein
VIKELLCKWFNIETPPCVSCDTLREQLAIANVEKRQLLDSILSLTRPSEQAPAAPVDYDKLKPRTTTWNVRRQMLEAEDRKQAQVLAEQRRQSEIERLEKELKITEEVKADV